MLINFFVPNVALILRAALNWDSAYSSKYGRPSFHGIRGVYLPVDVEYMQVNPICFMA